MGRGRGQSDTQTLGYEDRQEGAMGSKPYEWLTYGVPVYLKVGTTATIDCKVISCPFRVGCMGCNSGGDTKQGTI